MPPLPPLTKTPKLHPGCCLSLSQPLLTSLATLITDNFPTHPHPNPLLVSIGSGTGLLEAHLQTRLPAPWRVEGVEVSLSVNTYLPPDRMVIVPGSFAVSTRALDAAVLMFVYPRSGALVRQYLEVMARERGKLVLWLGPRVDWEDTGFGTSADEVVVMRDCAGVAEFEMLALLRIRGDGDGIL
ncbi:hypothetical protein GGS21DRAFT_517880 [Xylaria nigripes]|nr:hypothetical protein GGS21DRAFT_517880 [Xylaria nigripes]